MDTLRAQLGKKEWTELACVLKETNTIEAVRGLIERQEIHLCLISDCLKFL